MWTVEVLGPRTGPAWQASTSLLPPEVFQHQAGPRPAPGIQAQSLLPGPRTGAAAETRCMQPRGPPTSFRLLAWERTPGSKRFLLSGLSRSFPEGAGLQAAWDTGAGQGPASTF